MLKLEATLIATTAVRPRRGGWSPDHGIDFIASDPGRRTLVVILAEPGRAVAAEKSCFLDEDDILSPGTTVVRRYVSLATRAAEAAARDHPDVPLTRAWSSLARKAPGS